MTRHLFIPHVSHSMIRYTDIHMGEFICPLFYGCIVCVTGLSSVDRKEIQRLTVENGGQYMGQLKMNECTHLIVQEPKGKILFETNSIKRLEHMFRCVNICEICVSSFHEDNIWGVITL